MKLCVVKTYNSLSLSKFTSKAKRGYLYVLFDETSSTTYIYIYFIEIIINIVFYNDSLDRRITHWKPNLKGEGVSTFIKEVQVSSKQV